MRKTRAIAVLTLLLVSAVALIGILTHKPEPSHLGWPITKWVEASLQEDPYATLLIFGPENSPRHEWQTPNGIRPEIAVRIIGTHGLEVLLDYLRRDQLRPPLSLRIYNQMPAAIRNIKALSRRAARVDPAHLNQIAVRGFAMLGPQASPALPELMSLVEKTNSAVCAYALLCIGELKTNGSSAFPIIFPMAHSPGSPLSRCAVAALGRIRTEPDATLPLLTNWMASKSQPDELAAIYALMEFGPDARDVALPALRICMQDPNAFVRETATNAFYRIAPDLRPVRDFR